MLRLLFGIILVACVVACSGPNPAEHFCADYGNAMRGLYAAAGNYEAAPAEFTALAVTTKDDLTRIRAGAPNEELRHAFDSAYFSLTVFDNDAGLADFLVRTDFTHDDVVKACAENGIQLKPAEG